MDLTCQAFGSRVAAHTGDARSSSREAWLCVWSVLLLASLLLPSQTGALDFDPLVTIRENSNGLGGLEFAAHGNSSYVVWIESVSGGSSTLYVARSQDFGETYEAPTPLRTTGVSEITVVADPEVAVRGNEVFVVWGEFRDSISYIMMRRSDDGGSTFQAPVVVHDEWPLFNAPTLAASEDHLHVAWLEPSNPRVVMRSSSGSEGSWSDPVDVVAQDARTINLLTKGSIVYVGFSNVIAGSSPPIAGVVRSTNSGGSFGTPVTFDAASSLLSMAESADRIYAVYQLGSDVKLRVSDDGGASFGQPLDVAATSGLSGIAAHAGMVAVGWRAQDGSGLEVGLSVNDGQSFFSSQTVHSTTSFFTAALHWPGLRLQVAFLEPGSPTSGIYARRSVIEPVVFVPGGAGSVLFDQNGDEELWPALLSQSKLSLHPQDNPDQYEIVATDPIREVEVAGFTTEIYGPFLDFLTEELDHHPYELFGAAGTFIPGRLTEALCDVSQSGDGPTPSLFLFPYDWRQDNALNAQALQDYIGCVRAIHPDREVSIVTHSMGSLLARRYILDQGSNHHVERLITIGAPWLGAPKMLNVLDTGAFFENWMVDPVIKHILGSFDAAHQLLPSRAYTESLGAQPPLVEAGRDLDGDGSDNEVFSHDEAIAVVDSLYGLTFTPGTTGETFHSVAGQDDWSSDTRSIEYFHIYGVQKNDNTIGQIKAKSTTACKISQLLCLASPSTELDLTSGDGTVPTLSASRQPPGGEGLNDPDAKVCRIESPHEDQDKSVEHNGLMGNSRVHGKVVEYLFGEGRARDSGACDGEGTGSGPLPLPTSHRVVIVGAESIIVSDEAANELSIFPDRIVGEVPAIGSFRLGSGISMLTLPTSPTRSFTIGLITGNSPVAVEVTTGSQEEVTDAVRFLDLTLVAGRAAMLTVSGMTVSDLDYDSTGDGLFDATIVPTVRVSGADANDVDPPEISIDQDPAGSSPHLVTLTIEANDLVSGPAAAYYSLDGSQYQQVGGPIDVDASEHPTLWVWADDHVGNRATRIVPVIDPDLVFADGFESNGLTEWDASQR